MSAYLFHRLTAVFAVAYGSLGASAWVTAYYNEEAVRSRYVAMMAADMGLAGDIERVENVDLSHRRLWGVTVQRPDTGARALTAPEIAVEQLETGGRIFTFTRAVLDLGDARWMSLIRWPHNPNQPILAVRGEDCTLIVRQDLGGGRMVRLELTGVSGELDFRNRPYITADLRAAGVNGFAAPAPLRVTARMRRGPPKFAVEEARISFTPALPLAAVAAGLPIEGPPPAGEISGDLILRRPAEDERLRAELDNVHVSSPAGELSLPRAAIDHRGVELAGFAAEVRTPLGPVHMSGPGGAVRPGLAGVWTGGFALSELAGKPAAARLQVVAVPPGQVAAAAPPAAPAVPINLLRLALTDVPVEPLAALHPALVGVKSGRLSAGLDLSLGREGPELTLSASATGLSIPELGKAAGADLAPGKLDLAVKALRLAGGALPRALEAAGSAEWTLPAGNTAKAAGTLTADFDYPGGRPRIRWRAEDFRLVLPPFDGTIDLAGRIAWPDRTRVEAAAEISRLGKLTLVAPLRAAAELTVGEAGPALAFSAAGDDLPLADLAGLLGAKAPAGALRFAVRDGLLEAGAVKAGTFTADAKFGSAAKPRGSITCQVSLADGVGSAAGKDLDLLLLGDLPGLPAAKGTLGFAVEGARLSPAGLASGKLTVKAKVDDLKPVCKHFGLDPLDGSAELDKFEAVVSGGRIASLSATGKALGMNLAQISKAAGWGRVDGQVDLWVYEATLADGGVSALKAELSESEGYKGSRNVSKETLKILVEKIGLTKHLAVTSLDYDCLGATLTRKDGKYIIEGTKTTSPKVVARLKVLLPAPIYLPDSVRIRDAADYADYEKAAWEAVRSLELGPPAPAKRP